MKPKKRLTAAELLHALNGESDNGESDFTVEGILDGFIRQLGGVDAFCQELALDYQKATPGSPTRLRISQFIVNLMIAHMKTAMPQPNVSDLSDEDLEREVERVLKKIQGELQDGAHSGGGLNRGD